MDILTQHAYKACIPYKSYKMTVWMQNIHFFKKLGNSKEYINL